MAHDPPRVRGMARAGELRCRRCAEAGAPRVLRVVSADSASLAEDFPEAMAERGEARLRVEPCVLQALALGAKPLRRLQTAQTGAQALVRIDPGLRDDDAEAVKTRQRRELEPAVRLGD